MIEEHTDNTDLKARLRTLISARLTDELDVLRRSLREIQADVNNETKSSAGDKYETARAMAQLEVEKLSASLQSKELMLNALHAISLTQMNRVAPGSLVECDSGVFFISVNGGEYTVNGQKIYAISPAAPLASAMINRTTQESFVLNGRTIKILTIS